MAEILVDLVEHPYLIYPLMLGTGILGAVGIALLGIGLYGFCRWVEVKKAQIRRKLRRKRHLHYEDML